MQQREFPAAGPPRAPTRPRGRRWYYEANSGRQAQSALYSAATPALDGNATLVLDPNALAADGSVSASGYAFSWDGSLMAYRTSRCARALLAGARSARPAGGLAGKFRACAAEGQGGCSGLRARHRRAGAPQHHAWVFY